MYVCICNAVTDKQIRKAAREGCTSLRELSCRTACSTTCGKCARMAREILDEELKRMDENAQRDEPFGVSLAYPAS